MQTLRTANPTARKAHHCDFCFGPIDPGETYNRQTNVYDGRVYDWLTCDPCRPLYALVETWLGDYYDDCGYGPDEAEEWARDNAGDPRAVAYLARREAVWQQQTQARAAVSR